MAEQQVTGGGAGAAGAGAAAARAGGGVAGRGRGEAPQWAAWVRRPGCDGGAPGGPELRAAQACTFDVPPRRGQEWATSIFLRNDVMPLCNSVP